MRHARYPLRKRSFTVVLCAVIFCLVTGGYEHFGGTCCLSHLGRRKLCRIFYVLGSVRRELVSIIAQQDATLCILIIFSADSSARFG